MVPGSAAKSSIVDVSLCQRRACIGDSSGVEGQADTANEDGPQLSAMAIR